MGLRFNSFLGLVVFFLVAFLLSENRNNIRWNVVVWGFGLQFFFALLLLRADWLVLVPNGVLNGIDSILGTDFFPTISPRIGIYLFEWIKKGFDLITEASGAGAQFLFGSLTEFFILDKAMVQNAEGQLVPTQPFVVSAVVAFKVLPVIIFVSACSAILQHLGIIQKIVKGLAWLMQKSMKTSGAETFTTGLLVFLGIESMSAVRGYIENMTRSELFTIMTAFLATIAVSVMVAYANFGAEPGHLITASIMSAPSAIAFAKILIPETETPRTTDVKSVDVPIETQNIFDAASQGASIGLTMALNVGALLIVFVGLIHLCDTITVSVTGKTLSHLLSYLFLPFAYLMGVQTKDISVMSELLAVKSVFNEFLAYQRFQVLIENNMVTHRTLVIATYALCGFANPGSLGIMIGGISALAPQRRAEIATMSIKAFIAGTLACFSTACIAGIISS
ncbi:MAG TPA: nucleoside transporter C-terminal domain-containing protein [Candidatus Hydrogenedens sp.]|nr:nucleoside transporter C-terminal domain-containing protein [Candidatus Hydrogenedens sp.]HOL20526.1 nucleoside transporter C-terminal domain-containing protein [Candidatus Hydrogenedens sp.]HPP58818.1 nucleoside transporter C-terminal domain-containing protein [Candidatus Hydrogenedens sp.]